MQIFCARCLWWLWQGESRILRCSYFQHIQSCVLPDLAPPCSEVVLRWVRQNLDKDRCCQDRIPLQSPPCPWPCCSQGWRFLSSAILATYLSTAILSRLCIPGCYCCLSPRSSLHLSLAHRRLVWGHFPPHKPIISLFYVLKFHWGNCFSFEISLTKYCNHKNHSNQNKQNTIRDGGSDVL